jgi:hypothetical protein
MTTSPSEVLELSTPSGRKATLAFFFDADVWLPRVRCVSTERPHGRVRCRRTVPTFGDYATAIFGRTTFASVTDEQFDCWTRQRCLRHVATANPAVASMDGQAWPPVPTNGTVAVDMAIDEYERITACYHCADAWHAEIFGTLTHIGLREYHLADCPVVDAQDLNTQDVLQARAGAAAAGIAVASVKMAADFQKSMSLLQAQAGASAGEIANMVGALVPTTDHQPHTVSTRRMSPSACEGGVGVGSSAGRTADADLGQDAST